MILVHLKIGVVVFQSLPWMSHPRPRPGMASMDVILAPAVALCSGRSDSTQKLDSTGDLLQGQCHHHQWTVHSSIPPYIYLACSCWEEGQRRPHLRRRGGAVNARRRGGRAAADEAEDLAGAARRREADERSSDLALAAAIGDGLGQWHFL